VRKQPIMDNSQTQKARPAQILGWILAAFLCVVGLYFWHEWRYPMQSWEDIQKSGGMRIGFLVEKNGRLVIPVEYDITGREKVTIEPTRKDRELMIEDILVERQGQNIILKVRGTLAVLVNGRTDLHYANLTGTPAGKYNVYYETADPEKLLGKVEIK